MNYNKEFVENLINEHSTTLVRFARRMNNLEDAEDIAQAAFIRLYTLDDPEKLSNAKPLLSGCSQYVRRPAARRYCTRIISSVRAKAPSDGVAPASSQVEDISLERRWKPGNPDIYLCIPRGTAAKSKTGLYPE